MSIELKKSFIYLYRLSEKIGPYNYDTIKSYDIVICPCCKNNGPYKIDSKETIYSSYQRITIQDHPSIITPGIYPKSKEIILTNDLVNMVKPGDEIEIIGIYKSIYDINSNLRNSFPLFKTYIEANYITKINDIIEEEITEKDKKEIIKLSKKINISKIIINSIAPSIYDHEIIKKALAVSLFGGVPKDIEDKHKIRGDINILLLGDPGTAKSQLLKYILKIFPKSLYTTAKSASGVGLTACVLKDLISKEWILIGGSLVLADKGICLIDEFDKMNIQDRTYIHEAMEQQSISVSKAGIVTSLNARCGVIAAANPIGGRYNNLKSVYENVELTDPILSRFDLICPVKDIVEKKSDEDMATNIINSHIMAHPLGFEKMIYWILNSS